MLYNGPLLGGRYRLGPLLGQGGMSVVHRARDLATGTDVAVKLFASGVSFDAKIRQQREVALSRGLAHPGIAAVLDFSRDDTPDDDAPDDDAPSDHSPARGTEPAYLVSELVDGPTLRARVNRWPLNSRQAATLGVQLAGTLAYLHEHGIVHRDIKPANVLLPGEDDAALAAAKLADFGVALRLEDTRVTIAGNVVGTATYLSPEQVTGGDITPASDVYALGLLLIECLTGQPSFTGSGVECALARLHRAPAIPQGVPAALADLLAAMTALEPGARPGARDVERGLNHVLEHPLDAIPLATGASTAVLPELAGAGVAASPAPVEAAPDAITSVLPVPVDPAGRRRTLIRRGAAVGAGVAAAALLLAMVNTGGASGPKPASTTPTKPVVVVNIPSTSSSPPAHVVATSVKPSPTAAHKPAPMPAPKKRAPAPKHGPPKHGPGHGHH